MDASKKEIKIKNIDQLTSLLAPIEALKELMVSIDCRWMVIGGVAVSLLSKPRFTADVDIVALIDDDKLSSVIPKASQYDLFPRIKNCEKFAQENRMLLFFHKPSGISIDISLGLLPFEKEAILKSQLSQVGSIIIPLPRLEDLIVFKAVAHRLRDILDIQTLVSVNPKIDKKYLKKVIKEFSATLDMPEIWNDVEKIIKKDYP